MQPIGLATIRANRHTQPAAGAAQSGIPEVIAFGGIDVITSVTPDILLITIGDGAAGTLFGTDFTGLAKILNAKIYGFIWVQGKIGGDDGRPEITA